MLRAIRHYKTLLCALFPLLASQHIRALLTYQKRLPTSPSVRLLLVNDGLKLLQLLVQTVHGLLLEFLEFCRSLCVEIRFAHGAAESPSSWRGKAQ